MYSQLRNLSSQLRVRLLAHVMFNFIFIIILFVALLICVYVSSLRSLIFPPNYKVSLGEC